MATQGDVRRIALSLPGASEDPDEFRFLVAGKMFVWLWPERIAPKKARVPNPEVIVVRVGNDIDKQVLLAMDREVFFTEPHYDGYPAVLVHLPLIDLDRLTDIVTEGWRSRAPKRLTAVPHGRQPRYFVTMSGSRRVLRVVGQMIAMSLFAVLSAEDSPRCLPAPPDPREVRLSDQQLKEAILRNFGPEVASSLRHRVTASCVRLDRRW